MQAPHKASANVLIVDDSSTFRQHLRIALSVAGVNCQETEDGITA